MLDIQFVFTRGAPLGGAEMRTVSANPSNLNRVIPA
jgi:hypothetical protein